MSTRTKNTYQDPRYLQLLFSFEWPAPSDRMAVVCGACAWRNAGSGEVRPVDLALPAVRQF